MIEGLRIVGEAVQQGASIEELIIAPDLLISEFGTQLVASQRQAGINVLEVSSAVFDSLAMKEGPQGIAAIVRQKYGKLNDLILERNSVWVALDAVQDPGNLGTIIRTLDSVGGKGIIILDNATDPFHPTALRASMGAVFSLNIVRTNFSDFSMWKTKHNVPVVGTSGKAQLDYHYAQYPPGMILLMGSERQGLLPHHLDLCDTVVRIPMAGRSDSLNLAVSTAVVLYEIFNQGREHNSDEVAK